MGIAHDPSAEQVAEQVGKGKEKKGREKVDSFTVKKMRLIYYEIKNLSNEDITKRTSELTHKKENVKDELFLLVSSVVLEQRRKGTDGKERN